MMKKIKNIIVSLLTIMLVSCNSNSNYVHKEKEEPTHSTNIWTVKLDLNYEGGGIYKSFEVERKIGGTNIKSTLENEKPTRDNYKFEGWYHDTYCKVEWVYIRDKVLSDTTLYALWTSTAVSKSTINWKTDDSFTYVGNLLTSVNQGSEVSFGISINQDYEGTPVVKANNKQLNEVYGKYTFIADANVINISVSGLKKKVIIPTTDVYHIEFSLPTGWSPKATNPRLHYWGSESSSSDLFTNGATSNMTLLEENTYYIELSSDINLKGLIIIFDQGNEVKQSIDIVDSLPTSAGEYVISVDWSASWTQNTSGVYCFSAKISQK